ncbi:MAG: proline--tRNA ligase, partial [Chloroflexi bacterium]|nr:proline--tRNA ligase [Chloroflexota bacterium]
NAAGLSTLFDDRSETAGVKFNDADLLGLPVRVVVSPRNLKQGVVEIKERSSADAVTVPTGEAIEVIRGLIEA